MRSNAYTNAYEMMFVLSKGKPATFNPLKEPTRRHGYEMLPHNKLPDGINKKTLKELKKEKTRTNIWSYAVGLGRHHLRPHRLSASRRLPGKLALDHILSWSNPGDLVLDPCAAPARPAKWRCSTDAASSASISPPIISDIARQRLADCGLYCDSQAGQKTKASSHCSTISTNATK